MYTFVISTAKTAITLMSTVRKDHDVKKKNKDISDENADLFHSDVRIKVMDIFMFMTVKNSLVKLYHTGKYCEFHGH